MFGNLIKTTKKKNTVKFYIYRVQVFLPLILSTQLHRYEDPFIISCFNNYFTLELSCLAIKVSLLNQY